jgi:lipid A 3-O-deacylase
MRRHLVSAAIGWIAAACGLLMASGAGAADVTANLLWWPQATPLAEANSFEVRFGGFAHGVGGKEKGSADVNVELLFPRLPLFGLPPELAVFVPRPQVGVMINTAGKTSYVYGGAAWTVNITPRFFLEPMFGGVVHNGQTEATDPDRTGLSAGFRFDERWTLLATWDHISNAGSCSRNVGLNNYGLKLGYRF